MSEELYRVVLKGYATGKGEYYIEVDFARLFKITEIKAKELLQSSPRTLKQNLSHEQAEKFKAAIAKTGAVCEVESMMFDIGGLSLD